MRAKTAIWMTAAMKYAKVTEDGQEQKTVENYVLQADGFTECEKRMIEELGKLISGDYKIVAEAYAPFREVFFSEDEKDDRYYKVKVKLITLDEMSGKEKKQTVTYLVQASSTAKAEKNTKEVFKDSTTDYVISSVSETKYVDVFE
jgi:hypothetical protein